jgi:methyl-accepting chemotaxis protein
VAASEQSQGIGQVNGAVDSLDQMTQQNAALVEESAAAAESLREQAVKLSQSMQVFRIAGQGGVAHAASPAAKATQAPRPTPAPAPAAAAKPAARPAPAASSPAPRAAAPAASPAPRAAATATADSGDWESF